MSRINPWYPFFGVLTLIILLGYPWVAVGLGAYSILVLAVLRFLSINREDRP